MGGGQRVDGAGAVATGGQHAPRLRGIRRTPSDAGPPRRRRRQRSGATVRGPTVPPPGPPLRHRASRWAQRRPPADAPRRRRGSGQRVSRAATVRVASTAACSLRRVVVERGRACARSASIRSPSSASVTIETTSADSEPGQCVEPVQHRPVGGVEIAIVQGDLRSRRASMPSAWGRRRPGSRQQRWRPPRRRLFPRQAWSSAVSASPHSSIDPRRAASRSRPSTCSHSSQRPARNRASAPLNRLNPTSAPESPNSHPASAASRAGCRGFVESTEPDQRVGEVGVPVNDALGIADLAADRQAPARTRGSPPLDRCSS